MKTNRLLHLMGTGLMLSALVLMGVNLTSCQKKFSPMDSIEKLADKNIPGSYAWIDVDSTAMKATVTEYQLAADGTGKAVVAVSGNGMDVSQTSADINWSRGEFIDGNAFVELSLLDKTTGNTRNIKWGSAALFLEGKIFGKSSKAAYMKGIYTAFPNTNWGKIDSTFYNSYVQDTTYYLEWNQAKNADAKLTQAQIDALRDYFAQQWVKDTIAWYNKTFNKNIPDSVKVGKKSGETYLCVYYIATETKMIKTITTPLAESETNHSSFHFDRDASFANTGEYYFHYFQQDSTHYLNPTDPKANAKDSLYRFEVKQWCIGNPLGNTTFDVVARGTLTHKYVVTTAGKAEVKYDRTVPDTVIVFAISGLYDDECTINGVKHTPIK